MARKGTHLTEEHKAQIRAKLKGRPLSAETRAKMSAARRGRYTRDEVRYRGAHDRAREHMAGSCGHCGADDRRLTVSLRHDTPVENLRVETTGCNARKPYSCDPADYITLCYSCHKLHDIREAPWLADVA